MSGILSNSDTISRIAAANWRDGASLLLASCRAFLPGQRLDAYILDLQTGHFANLAINENTPIESFRPSELAEVRNLFGTTYGSFSEYHASRGGILVAIVFSVGQGRASKEIQQLVDLYSFLYNRRNSERLAFGLNKPISFDAGQEEFLLDLKSLARESSGIQYGAYRSINGEWLSCLFSWGFESQINRTSDLDIGFGELPPIDQAIKSRKPVVTANLPAEYSEIIDSKNFLSEVVSFCAVPILVGDSVEGVVSFAVSVPYEFSEAEQNAFLCIANGMGVALSNFRLYWDGRSKGAEFDRISSSIVGVEVAQSIRHSIYDSAGNIIRSLGITENRLNNLTISSKQKEFVRVPIELAREEANKIDSSVSNMRDVMTVDRTLRVADIKTLWQECIHHLKYRIDEMGVHIPEIGKREKVPLLADMVKHIFHNLLLNSLDAFEGVAKSKRQISLSIDRFDKSSKQIFITYADTGPGLEIQRLEALRLEMANDSLVSYVTEHTSLGELIFLPRITTRPAGTGYGLYLCRRMATYHNGDIEYSQPRDNRGVSFKISLCFDIFALHKKNAGRLQFFDRKGEKLALEPDDFMRRISRGDVQ